MLFSQVKKLENDLAVYQDVLEHDFGVTEISEKEYNARLVLSKLDKGVLLRSLKIKRALSELRIS